MRSFEKLLPYVLAAGAILALGVFFGLVAASGIKIIQVLLIAGLGGILLLTLPLKPFLGVVLISTFVVQGLASYFLKFSQAQWLPYLLCILAVFKLILTPKGECLVERRSMSWPLVFLFGYFSCVVISTLVNMPRLAQIMVGMKNVLPIWVVSFLIIRGMSRDESIREFVWKILRGVFYLQVPFVLYQHFVIVPSRPDKTTAMDAVVGTFGGLIDAGGANATLVAFALFIMACELALFVRKDIGWPRLILAWGTGLLIIFSGEVKAAFLWLPLTVLFIMRRRIFRSFGAFLMAVCFSVMAVVGMFAAYEFLYWSKGTRNVSVAQRIERMGYFFDSSSINYRTGEISRGASISLWLEDPHANPATRLLGYGVAASRVSATGGLGEVAARHYPLSIAATSTAVLLWDSGLLGFFCFVMLLLSLLRAALLRYPLPDSSRQAAEREAWALLMLIMLSLLVYNRSLMDEPSIQMLLAMAAGFLVHGLSVISAENRRPVSLPALSPGG